MKEFHCLQTAFQGVDGATANKWTVRWLDEDGTLTVEGEYPTFEAANERKDALMRAEASNV